MSTNRRASKDASFIAITPSTAAIARQRVGLEVDTGQRRLELEQDERQPDIRDRLVVGDRHAWVERLAEVGRDREDEQRIGAGGPEVTRLADRGIRRWTGQPGHDRQVGDLADDLQDANLLVVGQVRPLPRVDVDRQRDRALHGDPADVPAQRRFIDPAVPIHGQHGRGDQAIQVQRHGIAPSVRWSEVSVYYRTPCTCGRCLATMSAHLFVTRGVGRPS